MTLRTVEANELLGVEGGLGRPVATPGNTFELWRDIKNNGGWVDPTPPPPTGGGPLDYHKILGSASFPD